MLHKSKIVLFSTLFLLLAITAHDAFCVEITGPDARVENDEIVVATGLTLDEKNLADLRNGISKDITFYIDLFRVWRMWPDEFITGKVVVRTLRCDPIKKAYSATSFDGTTLIEKRFRQFESMINWALNLKDMRLANVKELELSDYFVKVTVESRLRKLLPVINYLLFFVPQNDFRIVKNSYILTAGQR